MQNTMKRVKSIIIFIKGNPDEAQCVQGGRESNTDESICL